MDANKLYDLIIRLNIPALTDSPEMRSFREDERADQHKYVTNMTRVVMRYRGSPEEMNRLLQAFLEIEEIEMAISFIQNGANPNLADHYGWTALMYAARHGTTEMVQALINAEANLDAQNNNGCTALMYAARWGTTEMVQALINAEANLDAQDNDGWTALMYATRWGRTEMVQALIQAGADLDTQDNHGWTALMIAARNGITEMVQALINAEANLDAQNNDGWTALMYAARWGKTAIVQALLEANANINAQENNGCTALIYAARWGKTAIVQALLEANANINAQENNGWTALIYAARWGTTGMVQALLEANADINVQNNSGCTALIYAARHGTTEMVQALLFHGAFIPDNIRDHSAIQRWLRLPENMRVDIVAMHRAMANKDDIHQYINLKNPNSLRSKMNKHIKITQRRYIIKRIKRIIINIIIRPLAAIVVIMGNIWLYSLLAKSVLILLLTFILSPLSVCFVCNIISPTDDVKLPLNNLENLERNCFSKIDRTYQQRLALRATKIHPIAIANIEGFVGNGRLETRLPKAAALETYVRDKNTLMIRRLLSEQENPLTEERISRAQLKQARTLAQDLTRTDGATLLDRYVQNHVADENPHAAAAAAAVG